MTLPPRWSELEEEHNLRSAGSLGDGTSPLCPHCGNSLDASSKTCHYPGMHATLDGLCSTCDADFNHVCSMTPGCYCCDGTYQSIQEQGNHNRFAVNDTANDEMYMDIGPIAGTVTGDALPGPQPVMQDENVDPSAASIQADPNTQMPTTTMASTWTASTYLAAMQREASDSDVFYQGYDDAVGGKKMDEGLANLSMDYYQGYKQGLLYNNTNLESAPPSPQDIHSQTYYEMPKSAPRLLPGNSPK